MTVSYLALGSNLNNPQRQLRQAIQHLRKISGIHVHKIAKFYSNQAWGRKAQPGFYNTVVAIHTSLTPDLLLSKCHEIEQLQGRQRRVKWGARTIDVDIILYGMIVFDKPHLIIPHPRMLERDFVLTPLLEIAPMACLPDGSLIVGPRPDEYW